MRLDAETGNAVRRRIRGFSKPTGRASIDLPPIPWPAANENTAGSDLFPELDCVRHLLPARVLIAAQERATAVGVGADRALIAAGAIDEETYLRALGERLGIAFEPLDGLPRQSCPLDDERLIEAARTGLLPLNENDDLTLVVAPRGTAARRILHLIDSNAELARRFRFTTADRFHRFVLRHAGEALAIRATERLRQQWPALSATFLRRRFILAVAVVTLALLIGTLIQLPPAARQVLALPLACLFLAWLGLRLVCISIVPSKSGSEAELPNHERPVYTVIAALYREAKSVDSLLSAIERLNYAAEKLDVIIALETDDQDTRSAIERRRNRLPITLVTVPNVGPRTKPKALNVALSFARGTFTVIYDAEDRPEPKQLHQALQAFGDGGERLACVQAPLCIDNSADGWLTRLFTAEYASHFDVFLPRLAALRLPLPLGGTSNHFRTDILREIGGWDPYNVTEDADLGIRLARFGYRVSTIEATTYEEAPAQIMPWLRQRTRWFKGWIQTWLVHMRTPHRLWRELGWKGFLAFQLIVGGNVLAALVHPIFLAGLMLTLLNDIFRSGNHGTIIAPLYETTAAAGYIVSGLVGFLGLARRRLLHIAWVLLLIPVHWLLLSLAAWRALYQFAVAPYAWEKTEHGLAKSSRLADDMTRTLVDLERYLSLLKERGRLPALTAPSRTPQMRDRPTRFDRGRAQDIPGH